MSTDFTMHRSLLLRMSCRQRHQHEIRPYRTSILKGFPLMHSSTSTQHAPSPTLDALTGTKTGKVVAVVSASLFVAVCAHFTVPLWFTPVPLTLSDLAVLLVGLLLGPRMAFAALFLYLAEGAAGLPVFAPAGLGGIAQILGPTGGFLMAYPFAAAVAGAIARSARKLPRFGLALLGSLAASTLLMTSGAAWFSLYAHRSAAMTLSLAVVPFLPGQVIKIISAAGIYTSLRRSRRA
jgi:biotin transport system substrate-specific component